MMLPKTFERRGIVKVLSFMVILGVAAVVIFPLFTRTNESKPVEAINSASEDPRANCQSNLKQVALALMMYSQVNDEKLPPVKNSTDGLESPTNWAGALQPYLKTTESFRCPLDKTNNTTQRSSFGYNQRLSLLPLYNLRHPSSTIALFEVDSTITASTQTGGSAKDVTANTRHDDGANYAIADGSVKWLRPASIIASVTYTNEYTFAVK